MNANVPMFLDARARALAVGDWNLARAMDADLARAGYVVPTVTERVVKPDGMETAAAVAPERRGGRPRLPRCEHGKTPGNCRKCPKH